jgi:hypothetical protein
MPADAADPVTLIEDAKQRISMRTVTHTIRHVRAYAGKPVARGSAFVIRRSPAALTNADS